MPDNSEKELERFIARAFGYRLGFEWKTPEGRALAERVVLPDWERLKNSDADHWFRAEDLPGEQLRLQVQMQLTAEARDFLFVHAGVVGWQGRAIVVPGPSRAGKSTLVLELVRAGATYLSDEFAVFDREGLVHAYPRPLWQRLSKTKKQSYTAQDLGWKPGPALPVGTLLMTNYVAGASWRPRELEVESTLNEIWKEVRYPSCRPGAREWLGSALAGAHRLKGARGEMSECLPGLLGEA